MDSEVNVVNENEEQSTVVSIAPKSRRKPAARKPGARNAPAGKSRPGAAKRKPASRRKARATTIEGVIQSITGGVSVARAAIAEASGQGATVVRRAVGSASKVSRRTVTRLANEWKAMDPKKKARVLAALLGAAAAASAPLVRKSFKR
jgi:hypothetical protein